MFFIITLITLIVVMTAYKVWKINQRPSRREIAKAMVNFHAAVEAASRKSKS